MVYAQYIAEQQRWAILAAPDDEEALFHLESDGTIWAVGHGLRAMAQASERPIQLWGIEETTDR